MILHNLSSGPTSYRRVIQHVSRVILTSLGLPFALLATACTADDDYASMIEECLQGTLLEGRRSYWTQGTWVLTGSGQRSECSDEKFDTPTLKISSRPMRVRQREHFISLDPQGASTSGTNFTLDGVVGDKCVRFHTMETTDGLGLNFDFPGRFAASKTISGHFTGAGPDSCVSTGDFTVRLELDPIPYVFPLDAGSDTNSDALQQDACALCSQDCANGDTADRVACEQACVNRGCASVDASIDGNSPDGSSHDDPLDGSADTGDSKPRDGGKTDGGKIDGGKTDAGKDSGSTRDSSVVDAPDDRASADGTVAGDAGPEDDADAMVDASIAAPDGPEEYEYLLWDGINGYVPSEVTEGKTSCTMAVNRGGTQGLGGTLFGILAILGTAFARKKMRCRRCN